MKQSFHSHCSLCVFDMIISLLLKEKESRHFLFVVGFFFLQSFGVCAPQWRRYFPIYENDKHTIMWLYKRGAGPYSPKSSSVCRRKRGGTRVSSPRPRPLPPCVAPRGRQRPVSSVTSHPFSLDCLDLPRGPFPFQWSWRFWFLVFSFLLHSVWGFAPTAVSSPRRPAPLHRSPVFVPHHATCHSCGVNKEH